MLVDISYCRKRIGFDFIPINGLAISLHFYDADDCCANATINHINHLFGRWKLNLNPNIFPSTLRWVMGLFTSNLMIKRFSKKRI